MEQTVLQRPEILAPAGNADMLRAAVFAGADAVYLGLDGYNARRSAGNFDPDALREAGVEYMVVKNTMLRRAVAGTQYEALAEYFKGDTAIALSAEDPAAAARILCKVADADKSKRFTVKGGFCDGQVLDAAGVKSLSTMPNREGLLSMLAGSLNGIIGGLAVAIQGIVDKQEETPAA